MTLSGTTTEFAARERISDLVVIFRTKRSPRWYCQYNLDGRQLKPSLKTRSLKQARILAKQIDAKLTLGMSPQRQKTAVAIRGAVEKYLESQQRHVGENTLIIYRRDLEQFVAFSSEQRVNRVDMVTADHLEAFETRLRSVGSPRIRQYSKKRKPEEKRVRSGPNAAKTVRSKMKTIRQMIRWAVRRRMIEHDPAPGYRLPPETKSKPEPFTPSELQRLLDNAKPPFKDVFDFFRLTGLRNDELCWLMKADVDPQLRFIHVRAKQCPFSQTMWHPKHGNERIVPLCKESQEIVRRHLTANDSPWLFVAPHTSGNRPGQFRKGRIWKALKAVLKVSGIGHGTVHTFRHCFCSFLANQKVSPFLVMKFMGHSSLDIVMTYYHAATDDLLGGIAPLQFDKMLATTDETSQFPANHGKAGHGSQNVTANQKES